MFGPRPDSCFNRAERDGERIRALEARLRNLSAEERHTFLKSNNLPDESIEQYLSGAPCGSIGEAALKDFATRMPPQFSAGFVSLGAGLLLVAELLKSTAFAHTAPPRSDMTTLNFLNGGFLESAYAADPDCELNCQEHTAAVA